MLVMARRSARLGMLLACWLGCLALGGAANAEIYRWKDSAGRLHVTNDPTKVPPGKLEQARVNSLKDLNMVGSEGAGVGGSGLFAAKCGACHLAGMESTGDGEGGEGKLALLPFLLDDAGFPLDKNAAVAELRRAADGEFSDMPALSVTDEELSKIADYLLGKLKK